MLQMIAAAGANAAASKANSAATMAMADSIGADKLNMAMQKDRIESMLKNAIPQG